MPVRAFRRPARRRRGAAMSVPSLAEPHHDGSELYVVGRPEALGDEATVRLRVPRGIAVDEVAVRYVRDGEPRGVRAVGRRGDGDRRLVARELPGLESLDAVPLGAGRRRRRLRLGQRHRNDRGETCPMPTTSCSRRRPRGLSGTAGRRLPGLPRPLRTVGQQRPGARLGDRAGVGRASAGTGHRNGVRVLRWGSRRDRTAARPRRGARRVDPVPDADLPGDEHAPLRLDLVREDRPAPGW